jgi:hypothetical protein
VTAKGWSLMITIYYGTNLMAMFLVKRFDNFLKKHEKNMIRLIYAGLAVTAAIWAGYALTASYAVVLALQFVEGSVIAICGIILSAEFQLITDRRYMARVSSINDLFANAGKLVGLSASAFLIGIFSYRAVFVFCSAMMFLFTLNSLVSSKKSAR